MKKYMISLVVITIMSYGPIAHAAPIHEAIKNGNLAGVRAAIWVNPSAKDEYRHSLMKGTKTPLIMAVESGLLAIVQELIKEGADVNKRTDYDESPLMSGIEYGYSEIVKELIKAGANLDLTIPITIWGIRTPIPPLVYAAMLGRLAIVKELINAKVPVNQKTEKGGTPLMFAAIFGHLEIVKELINAGAEIDARIIPDVRKQGYNEIANLLEHPELAKEPLKAAVVPKPTEEKAGILQYLRKWWSGKP